MIDIFTPKSDEVVDVGRPVSHLFNQKVIKLLTVTAPEAIFLSQKNDKVDGADGTGGQTLSQTMTKLWTLIAMIGIPHIKQ